MGTFKTQDQDDKILFTDTHYYKWLENKQPIDIHNINTKVEYLTEQGFEKGRDTVTEEELIRLKYIEQYYFRFQIVGNGKLKRQRENKSIETVCKIIEFAKELGRESDEQIEKHNKWLDFISMPFNMKFDTDFEFSISYMYQGERRKFIDKQREIFEKEYSKQQQ
jgi:hypothetical protein